MKSKPNPKRFARTPQNILVALGCSDSREMKKKLRLWMSFPDFPKKTKNGFDIEELINWATDNVALLVSRGKLGKALERGEDYTPSDMKLLRAGAGGDAATGNGGTVSGPGGPVASEVMGYAGIAEVLARHFQIPVSKMDISDWTHGKRLDHGTPNFPPPKSSGRFNTLEAINWFRAHKYSDPRASSTPDLFKRLETERATGEMERLEHEGFMRRVERGHYMDKAEHHRILAGLGRIGRNNLWELFDRVAYDQFSAALAALAMPPEWALAAVTALRKLNPELLLKHHAHLESLVQEAEQETTLPAEAKAKVAD